MVDQQQAPAPAKGGAGKVIAAVFGCLALSVLGCCLFAIIGSKLDPEFQKKLADRKANGKTWVVAMRGKLAALAGKLPAAGSLQGEQKVAAADRAKVGEVLLTDTAFLSAYKADGTVAAPDSRWFHDEDLRSLTDDFKDSTNVDAWPDYQLDAAIRMVERMNEKGVVAVFLADALTYPVATEGSSTFQTGVADGQLVLLSLDDGRVLAHGPLHAESSDKVEVKSGVGIRIGPVHVGSVGGSNASEALTSDFIACCDKAVNETVERLKAP